MIKRISCIVKNYANRIYTNLQNSYSMMTFHPPSKRKTINIDHRCILIVPHADDELISAYGLIKNHLHNVTLFYCGFIGTSKQSNIKKIRQYEFETFCKDNGISYYVSGEPVKKELLEYITHNHIETIIAPSYIDWHLEHRVILKYISELPCEYLRNLRIILYSITVPIQAERTLFVKLTRSDLKQKYMVFRKYYKSQNNLPVSRFKLQERINGKFVNSYAAEDFLEVSYAQLNQFLLLDESKLDLLSNYINSVKRIRRESKQYYDSIFRK